MKDKKSILKNAKKWAKKECNNAVLARYYLRYCDLEDVRVPKFLSLVKETNVIDLSFHAKEDINPAMDFEVFINLMLEKERESNVRRKEV
jgi:hypothetical protein